MNKENKIYEQEPKNEFEKLLFEHLKLIHKKLEQSSNEMLKRAQEHDMDKLQNPIINETYIEHFTKLKNIPFGTQEYFNYEKENFEAAHQLHAQNRHHYYSKKNKLEDINLFDVLEAIIDISQSAKQYGDFDGYKKSLKNKQIFNYELEELIVNTVNYLEKL